MNAVMISDVDLARIHVMAVGGAATTIADAQVLYNYSSDDVDVPKPLVIQFPHNSFFRASYIFANSKTQNTAGMRTEDLVRELNCNPNAKGSAVRAVFQTETAYSDDLGAIVDTIRQRFAKFCANNKIKDAPALKDFTNPDYGRVTLKVRAQLVEFSEEHGPLSVPPRRVNEASTLPNVRFAATELVAYDESGAPYEGPGGACDGSLRPLALGFQGTGVARVSLATYSGGVSIVADLIAVKGVPLDGAVPFTPINNGPIAFN
jgi:hypothetical protein